MRKRLAAFILAGAIMMGGPLVGTAAATVTDTTEDPTTCFLIAQLVFSEAQSQYAAGDLTIRQLRSILVGTATFLGDCLGQAPEPDFPPIPPIHPPTIPGFPTFPTFPTFPHP